MGSKENRLTLTIVFNEDVECFDAEYLEDVTSYLLYSAEGVKHVEYQDCWDDDTQGVCGG